jgi:hypothetical protein
MVDGWQGWIWEAKDRLAWLQLKMKRNNRKKHRIKDIHFLNDNGMVACNPRDREAAHRAEIEGIATEDPQEVTCKKCLVVIRKIFNFEF